MGRRGKRVNSFYFIKNPSPLVLGAPVESPSHLFSIISTITFFMRCWASEAETEP